jgi:acetyl-CoA carboxylase biotin carboxyl carrier protein
MAMTELKADVTGSVWKIVASSGQVLQPGDTVMILESMKMEIPVTAPEAGTLVEVCVAEGSTCSEGAVVARLEV